MQIIVLAIVFIVLVDRLMKYETWQQKVEKSDNDPKCSIKSDNWYKAHPECRK